jgi:hypothetical protein
MQALASVTMTVKEHWKAEPEEHDYPAAYEYLSLVIADSVATALVKALEGAPLSVRKAKDLLRASGLAALPETNVHVAKDIAKVHKGGHLSPVLLVRGNAAAGAPLIIADGYHRICASYHLDEDANIPCRLVGLPEPS